jgi:hypothetical protein
MGYPPLIVFLILLGGSADVKAARQRKIKRPAVFDKKMAGGQAIL